MRSIGIEIKITSMQFLKRTLTGFIIAAAMIVGFAADIAARDFVVVIDAGHGGKDHGAIGRNAREKNVNLGVALKLGELIKKNFKDVKVVYTRSTDTFISLQGRADVANAAHGDLFISIHCNSVSDKARNRDIVNGTSVYVLGRKSEENLAVAQRENAVIMLEDDYKTAYAGFDPNSPESYIAFELIQNQHMEHSLQAARKIQNELVGTAGRKDNGVRQAMFWVLVKTGMPAVLVELDFICNPKVDRYLGSNAGQTQMAEALFNGFKAYKIAFDKELAALGQDYDSARRQQVSSDSDITTRNEKKAKDADDRAKKSKDKKKKDKKNETAEPRDAGNPQSTAQPKANTDGKIVYKVQFLVSPSPIPAGDRRLKGLDDVDFYRDGNSYKYTTGATTSLDDANRTLREVRRKFADAFIIKTRDGKRIK